MLACVLLAVILSGIIMITRRSKSQDTKEEITFEEISKEPESSQSQEETTQEETEEETETITYPQPEYDFTTEEVNVAIKGLDREYTLVWVSDLHLVSDHEAGDENGDVRPEYYYDCKMKTPDMQKAVQYTKEDQPINFEISSGIMLAANTQASDVLSTDIGRDMTEMMTLVSASTQAHDKVSQIEKMMSMDKYSDEESQKKLQTYLDAANKEATYADDNLSKTYQQFISNFDGYLNKVNVAHTNVGGLQQRVELTKTRVENQKETVEELKSNNDNRDISDIIIDYYAAYNAYTSSLTAASKVGSQTLLNYL